jgi:TonB family protein
MGGRSLLLTFLLVAAASHGAAQLRSWEPNDLIENKPVWSANGRFCVIVRWYPSVPDFKSERAGKVLGLDDPEPLASPIDENAAVPAEQERPITAALYESHDGSRELIAELAMDRGIAGHVLVSDSGRYVVVFHDLGANGGCIRSGGTSEDRLLTIYTIATARIERFKAGDVLSEYDITSLNRRYDADIRIDMRHESDEREIVALNIPAPDENGQPRFEELRIDLTTSVLLDPKHDIYPVPHAYATAEAPAIHNPARGPACASGAEQPIRIAAEELLARAIRGPLPELPLVAFKGNIRGRVVVEFSVSERGEVICTRSSRLPFGLDAAAEAAARRWRFRPYLVDGQPRAVVSEMTFHFEDLDAAGWARINRTLPPPE